jgi:hypothetical protein
LVIYDLRPKALFVEIPLEGIDRFPFPRRESRMEEARAAADFAAKGLTHSPKSSSSM